MKASELMEAMSRAGAPMEAILIAVRAIEERDEAIAAKRAVERDRKRRQRAKDTDGTVTGQSRDMDGTVTDEPSPSLSSPQTPQQTHPHPDNNTRARKGAGTPAKPDDVSAGTWSDFVAHRQRKKAIITPNVIAAIQREARDAGWPLDAALAEAVTSGWQTFKAEYVRDRRKPGATAGKPRSPLVASLLAERARANAGNSP